jgi:hypothetical protein
MGILAVDFTPPKHVHQQPRHQHQANQRVSVLCARHGKLGCAILLTFAVTPTPPFANSQKNPAVIGTGQV